MAKAVKSESEGRRRRPPARTAEEMENQMISLAMDVAKEKLMDGTASNQLIVHYLKLGSTKEQLEKEKLKRENELLVAKVEALESAKRDEELYLKVLDALKMYSGANGDYDDETD